jgi:hypothetical protein
MEDMIALHSFVTPNNVSSRISFRMTHMEASPRGIREHIENVILRLRRIESIFTGPRGSERFILGPIGMPLGLELIEWIWLAFLGHDDGPQRNHECHERHAKNALPC